MLQKLRSNRSQRSRWTGPFGPGNTPGPSRTDFIGSTRLGPKSVGLGQSRSGPDRGCPYLVFDYRNSIENWLFIKYDITGYYDVFLCIIPRSPLICPSIAD